ncbi:MAG: tetratricopeptide repeat protein [Alphaproteobacteria bacterium]
MSDNIFREVDEDVRRDRALKLWRAYGKYVITMALAVVLGVAGSVGWKEYRQRQRVAESAQFADALALLDKGEPGLAAQRFIALANEAGDGYGALARLRAAQSLAAAGDVSGAVALLDRLAGDDGVEPAMRDLARLLAVLHLMDRAEAGELDRRLEPLLREDSVWRASARELSGLVALRQGEIVRAREIFSALGEDAGVPAQLRSRAAEFLAILGNGAGDG